MIRRYIPYIIIVWFGVCASCLLSSCEYEMSDNGQLDGYWQLAAIEALDDVAADKYGLAATCEGNSATSCDLRKSRIFWSFQVNLLQLSDQNYLQPWYLFRFELRGDSLHIYNPYLLDRTSADQPLTDPQALSPYYLDQLDDNFLIERLDDDQMILRNELLRFFFNRY